MKTKHYCHLLFAALLATFSLSLAAEEVWLWPIEGQKVGEGVLYRPQDNIGKEFNFGNLYIAAPEGTRVLCPADAVVTSYNYTYCTSLTNSVTWGGGGQGYDALVAEEKDNFRSKGWDIRYLMLSIGLKIGDKTLWINGLRPRGGGGSIPTGTRLKQGDMLGTVGYAYHAISQPHIDLSVSTRSVTDDPMTPFGLRSTFRKPKPRPTKFHLTHEEATADYRQLASSVKEIYPSLDDLMSEAAYDAFVKEQLACIPADGIALKDFAALIKDYNAVIHDSHLNINCRVPADPKEQRRGLRYGLPSLFFGHVANSDSLGTMECVVLMADSAHAAYVGRRIARIDGKPAADLVSITRRNSTNYDAGVRSVGDYFACYWNAIDYGLELGLQPEGRTIVYEFEDGERMELPMVPSYSNKIYPTEKWARNQNINRRKRGPFEVRMVNDSVLYIGISTFSLNQVDCDSVVDAIHQAEHDSVPFLIFDVRNNYGGDAGVQARITRALLGRVADRPYTGYQKVNAALFKSPTMNWPEGDTIFAGFKSIEGRKGLYLMEEEEDNAKISNIDSLGYNGRLYVLIDSRSASASAFLAGAVKRNDRGYIVGRETMSAYHTETCIKFANISLANSQFTATIPMVRVVIDETVSDRLPALRGVIPDCDIPMTEAEFHYDGDYILDRTLQLIADGTYLDLPEVKVSHRNNALIFFSAAVAAVALLLVFLLFRIKKVKSNILLFVTLITCSTAMEAQQKQSGAYANGSHNTVLARKAIDTADLRIKYAWGATDITQDSTYLDCGQLLVGQRMTKYSSWFIEVADSLRVEWGKKNPHAQNVPNGTWWMRGRKPGIWSEYQYSSIYIHGDTLSEWAIMPMGQEWPQRYEEKWTGQEWTLQADTTTFLDHQCQRATCHWRGRDYIAWFASDIPIRRGPWKFGGLPGLIMKIHDVDSLYVFEAVGIEKGEFPIWQYPKEEFMKSSRAHTWKLQVAYNRNYMKTSGRRRMNPDGTIGDLLSEPHPYDPMELE